MELKINNSKRVDNNWTIFGYNFFLNVPIYFRLNGKPNRFKVKYIFVPSKVLEVDETKQKKNCFGKSKSVESSVIINCAALNVTSKHLLRI